MPDSRQNDDWLFGKLRQQSEEPVHSFTRAEVEEQEPALRAESVSKLVVDVDAVWARLERTTAALQLDGLLPRTSRLYDSRLDVVREYLRNEDVAAAAIEASELTRQNKAAGYMAHELLKEYCLAADDPAGASRFASVAAQLLRTVTKDLKRQQEPKRWPWRREG